MQLIGNAGSTWTAALTENVASGVEPVNLQPKPVMDRATGYLTVPTLRGTIYGDTDSPVSVEVTSRGRDLYLTVAILTGTGLAVVCTACPFTAARPAGASLFDLNFDDIPLAARDTNAGDDMEIMVAAYNGQP